MFDVGVVHKYVLKLNCSQMIASSLENQKEQQKLLDHNSSILQQSISLMPMCKEK